MGAWIRFYVEKIQNSGISKKKKRLIDRLIKKIKKENKAEFTCWCNRGRINKMTEKIDNNWKVNLVILESDIC